MLLGLDKIFKVHTPEEFKASGYRLKYIRPTKNGSIQTYSNITKSNTKLGLVKKLMHKLVTHIDDTAPLSDAMPLDTLFGFPIYAINGFPLRELLFVNTKEIEFYMRSENSAYLLIKNPACHGRIQVL